MRAPGPAAAIVAVLLLLPACSGSTPDDGEASPDTCTVSLDNVDIERVQLERLDSGGPVLDRDLRATRSPDGDLCVEIVTDHADPGSTAVSYRIVARQGDQEWRVEGEDPSGKPPMLVDASGCVTVTGELEVLGAGDRAYPYRARMRVRCDGRGSADPP